MEDDVDNADSGETTMYDLAEKLGVSVSTVSRALSGSASIGEKTRKKVIAAARAANYSVNPTARNLRQRTSRTFTCAIRMKPAALMPNSQPKCSGLTPYSSMKTKGEPVM